MYLMTLCHKEHAYDGRVVVRSGPRVVGRARSEDGVSCMTVSFRPPGVLDISHHISVAFHHNIER